MPTQVKEKAMKSTTKTKQNSEVPEEIMNNNNIIESIKQEFGIWIDNGYDGIKVSMSDKTLFTFPSDVFKVTKDESSPVIKSTHFGFMLYNDSKETYALGKFARSLLYETATHNAIKTKNSLTSQDRLDDTEYYVGIKSAIAKAVYLAAANQGIEVEEFLDRYELKIGVAVPHGSIDKYSEVIKTKLAGHSVYQLSEEYHEINMDITLKKENITICSQVLMALLCAILDDNGKAIEDIHNVVPALVLDPGWYTLGITKLSRTGIVVEDVSESNTQYAMRNVDEIIMEELSEKTNKTYKGHDIRELMQRGNYVTYSTGEKDRYEKFDLLDSQRRALDRVVEECIDYLDNQFDKLTEIKTVIVSGGNAKEYYNRIYKRKKELFDGNSIKLAVDTFNGEECEPVYSVAVGMYKAFVQSLVR